MRWIHHEHLLFVQVGLGGVGVPCADWAPGAGELCANSVPSAGEACAKSAAGSSQPRPAEGPLEQVMVEKEAPPSPEECHVEDVSKCPTHRCERESETSSLLDSSVSLLPGLLGVGDTKWGPPSVCTGIQALLS